MDIPKWAPTSVAAAGKRGPATGDDLFSGRAWSDLLAALARAGRCVGELGREDHPSDRAAGFQHLLVLLALGIDEALRPTDPLEPRIRPGNVDNAVKWGMDCPDAAYLGAPVHGDASYRLRGHRGTVRYLGFQVMQGMATHANLVADDLDVAADGTFELILSAEPRPGNWLGLATGAHSLVIRQFFYDWLREEPARLTLERIDGRDDLIRAGASADPDRLANQLVALGEFVEQSITFWADMDRALRDAGVNSFRPPVNRTDIGGAEENVTVWGSWEVGDDEALVIEVAPPECLYWSVSIGTRWWETIDYANHQSSLNGCQAVIDPDGVFRAVVSQRDPGVANWLDPAGHRYGPAIFRWVRAAGSPPVPQTRVVRVSDLWDTLPLDTVRVDATTRERAIAERRAGVAKRFAR